VRLFLGLLFTFAVAAVVGLGSTWLVLNYGVRYGSVQIGAWSAWPKTGTTDIDPYAKAGVARSGELPIGLGDGVAFYASKDDNGTPLDGRCDAVIEGITPQARYWTLTLYNREGQLIANSANRYGFTSQEIVRSAVGRFKITAAPRVRAGNWLPTAALEHYILVLRLYDTPVGVATRAGREAPMPSISQGKCT